MAEMIFGLAFEVAVKKVQQVMILIKSSMGRTAGRVCFLGSMVGMSVASWL